MDQVANVDVFLILSDDTGRLLVGLRAAHLYAGGQWNLVAGKADVGEDAVTAVIREAREEAGVVLRISDLTAAAVVHFRGRDDSIRVGFAFRAAYDVGLHGPVLNGEPHKCDALDWYPPDALPEPFEAYNRAVLDASALPVPIALAGW